MAEDSLFTKIIKKEIPAHTIYEDDKTIAFLDINPLQPGHVLIVPKKQTEDLWDLSDGEYSALMKTAKLVAKHLKDTLNCSKVGVMVEGFEVPHAHVHLIPLEKGFRETFDMTADHEHHDDLEIMAQRLKMN